MMMYFTKPTISPCHVFSPMSNVYFAGPQLEPLSAPQPTFEHGDYYTFSNCSLLHKLLITGQGEEVVSRSGELNRDLLSTTCEDPYGVTKVRCRVGLNCRLEIKILFTNRNKKQRTSDV